MNVHFIAIGGSAMHNLAIALAKKGLKVSGSDDEIFEPSKSRLEQHGLLPAREGWFPGMINDDLDAVILGMHAKSDNPELLRARELNIPIYSYPEYLYEQAKNKIRIVIGGSHGKTTITSIILHVLQYLGMDCDYMVGAQLEGFDVMVKISETAPFMVLEGDEYLTSPIDLRPKFHVYKPDIGLISGIAWDHVNVFPTYESYIEQFWIFAGLIPEGGTLIYCADDLEVKKIGENISPSVKVLPYSIPDYIINDGKTFLLNEGRRIPLQIFGEHNLLNLNGARMICHELGVIDTQFFEAIQTFNGASKRLEAIATGSSSVLFKDFAHSPSKLMATTRAVKEQYAGRRLVACLELHTYSSLNARFLNQYKNCMDDADVAIVYFNPHTVALKKLPPITEEQIKTAFGRSDLLVYSNSKVLLTDLQSRIWERVNLLMMSSGNFDGIDLQEMAKTIYQNELM
jgi:UDP-N-acetylmuramate: L-alanyl-gamma-D-glutamyl-meso-diaminopimelate ligase